MSSCGGEGSCQSNCLKPEEDETEEESPQGRIASLSISDPSKASDGDRVLCSKCGEEEQVYNKLCLACFRSSLFGKFKLAVTSNAMISPTDNVLVAFSGGPCSRVVLQFVHEMQCKAQKSWDASKDQALPVFGVGVAFINETAFSPSPSPEVDQAIEDIRLVVSTLAPPSKRLHIAPIESICSVVSKDGRSKSNELVDTITDATGKEDFLNYLRMLSLQKIASNNGYNKLVLGSCTSGIACHIISATVKGQGYSLPADVQYVDARWEIPVGLPLRDCLAQELTMLCHLDGLKVQQLLDRPQTGINGLVSSFVARLQVENPSRERTIVRTAEKLRPFCFNKLTENDSHDLLPFRMRRKLQKNKFGESTQSEILCPICGGPLCESDLQSFKSNYEKFQTRDQIFAASCCQSCCFQILPKDAVSLEHFYSLLPCSMTERVKDGIRADRSQLRGQIKDCLLSDDDDDGT